MSGAFTDAGTVSVDAERVGAITSPAVATDHVIRTMHGQLGSLSLRVETVLRTTEDPALLRETGHWVIQSGTDGFETILGQGEVDGTRNVAARTIDLVYSGEVQAQ
jgi:hypothetical protein